MLDERENDGRGTVPETPVIDVRHMLLNVEQAVTLLTLNVVICQSECISCSRSVI